MLFPDDKSDSRKGEKTHNRKLRLRRVADYKDIWLRSDAGDTVLSSVMDFFLCDFPVTLQSWTSWSLKVKYAFGRQNRPAGARCVPPAADTLAA